MHQRSSYAQLCRSMPHSKIAGVEKHPCGSGTRHVGPSGRVAALIFEAQAAPLELGDGMLWEPCPISPLPCPCLILARVRLPFRLATMASSACIASSQAAPAMPLRNIRCSPIFRRIRARVCISLYRSLYRRYRYVDRLSTKTSAPARTQ